MATQLTNYQCPACTGPLHFDGASGKLVCDFCGSSYDTAEIEALYAEKEAAAETAAQNKQAPPPDSVWSENEAAGLRSYSCPSCGAELICDETTAATSCPYRCFHCVSLPRGMQAKAGNGPAFLRARRPLASTCLRRVKGCVD